MERKMILGINRNSDIVGVRFSNPTSSDKIECKLFNLKLVKGMVDEVSYNKSLFWNTLDLGQIYAMGKEKYGLIEKDLVKTYECFINDDTLNLEEIKSIGLKSITIDDKQVQYKEIDSNSSSMDCSIIFDDSNYHLARLLFSKYDCCNTPSLYIRELEGMQDIEVTEDNIRKSIEVYEKYNGTRFF